ncbi:hypothetical protein B9Q04_19015 [Candidatus Marsarchaeota G2 archaeon BE_D]|jgi:hypothetical protein|uniref:Uncharacterized protein n=2 Tax=Candidatus Marsarchaeota G2 archaeon BE_D TaxID=1978158 RepID=A0A2R6C340_9ARCH|nr:MAG: hypothetical protein B9Q04_19015 [Candidatus Marsarchaeota G2 archaeon BE_D]
MQTYQTVGLIGSVLLLVGAILMVFYIPYGYRYGWWMMDAPMMYGSGFYYPPVFMIPFIAIPALVFGLAGSVVPDRLTGGVLLIISSILSLPVLFGVFGFSFALLLLSGIVALTGRTTQQPNSNSLP